MKLATHHHALRPRSRALLIFIAALFLPLTAGSVSADITSASDGEWSSTAVLNPTPTSSDYVNLENVVTIGSASDPTDIATANGILIQAGSLTLEGTGSLSVGGNTLFINSFQTFTMTGGTFNGPITAGTGSTLSLGNGIALNAQSLRLATTFSPLFIQVASGSASITGPINSTGAFSKTGAGQLTLSGSNSYSGGTTISAGVLEADTNNALGAGAVTVNAGTTLNIGSNVYLANNITISGTGTTGQGALYSIGSTLSNQSITGTVTLAADASVADSGANGSVFSLSDIQLGSHTLTVTAGEIIFGGAISGSGGLTIATPDAAISGGANTFTGLTDVLSGGILRLQDSTGTAISGNLTIENSGTVNDITGGQLSSSTVLTLNGSGQFIFQSSSSISETIAGLTGTSTSAQIVNAQAGAASLTLDGTGNYSYAGQIKDGSGRISLTMDGTGTQTLSGNNTYSGGTYLNAGTLSIGTDDNLGDSSGGLTFNGGTLETTAGFGSARAVSLTGTGTFQTDTGTLALSGNLGGAGKLIKTGVSQLTLSGSNSYSGGTTISAGVLEADSNNALGTGAVTVNAGTTLSLFNNSTDVTLANNITISGTGTTGQGAIYGYGTGVSGVSTIAGTVTLAAGASVGNNHVLDSSQLNLGSVQLGSHTLTVASGDVEFSGDINGTGGLIIAAPDAVIYGGANSFSGLTDVQNGGMLLLLDVGETAIPGNLTIENGGFVEAGSNNQLSPTTVVTINGTGQFNLNAAGGSLSETIAGLQSTSTSAAVTAKTTFGGSFVLTLDGTGTYAYAGTISNINLNGPLSLIMAGTGTQTLSGTNTYSGGTTISAGTLVVANNQALGTGTVTTMNSTVAYQNALTVSNAINATGSTTFEVDNADTAMLSGVISNVGPLTKVGTGSLVLTGTNTYSGGTTISAGTLAIANPAALGTGDVLNNGTLTATAANHLINIGGNYTQGSGGTLLLNIYSSTVYDSVHLTGSGTAHLNGVLALNLVGSFAPGGGQTFTLMTTNNPISGTFSSVSTNLPSIGATLSYTNNVTILYQNSFATLPSLNLNPNQKSTATYIDTYDKNITNPGFAALVGGLNSVSGNSNTLANSFSQLTPVNFANFASSNAFNNSAFSFSQLDGYLGNHRGGNGTFVSSEHGIDYSGLAVNDPNVDPGLQSIHSSLLAWSPAPSTGLLSDSSNFLGGVDMKDVAVNNAPTNLWNVFIDGNVILAQDFSNPAAGIPYASSTTGAAQIGADYKVTPHFLVGATFGYGHTAATVDNIGSNVNVNTYSPGVYASYTSNGWFANMLGSYGFASYSQNRNVNIGAFNGTAHSSPGGDQIVGNLDGGYEFHKANWTFGPTLGLGYTHLDVDGYSETGLPGADLTVASQQADSLRSRLGVAVSYAVKSGSLLFTPHFSASWQHEFLNQSRGITSQFSSVGAGSFVVATANPSQNSALADLGLDAQINNTLTLFTDYSVQAGQSNYFGQSVQAGLKIGF